MTHEPHRGISAGTVVMCCITLAVLVLSGMILPRLMGEAELDIAVGHVIGALTLDDALPALAMNDDIPIENATALPDAASTPAPDAATPTPSPVPSPTAAPTATPVPGGTITLTFGGSINIDDAVRKSAYYSDSGKYSFTEIMELLHDEMGSDIAFLTLENLTVAEDKVSALNAPAAVMDMLAEAGVDVLALGFPKAADKSAAGLAATIEAARDLGMETVGAYTTQQDADDIRIITVDHVDVAYLHYTQSLSSTGRKAIDQHGAHYMLPTLEVVSITADIRRARDQGADVVIVSLNWGKQSASKPTAEQKEIAQQLADAGADVIVGTGSRVVQPIAWLTARDEDGSIRQTLCAYSLGSLLNESRKDGNVTAMLLQLQIGFDGRNISFERIGCTPTYIWRYRQDGQYYYRIAVSDQSPPDGMDDDQIGYMEKALRNLKKYLDGSPITWRTR